MVESRIVIPIVVGSNPIIYPKELYLFSSVNRAVGYEPIGREFESLKGCQFYVSLA